MKYVSIDLETTGLNENVCQIIEIGAVIDDSWNHAPIEQLPTFHCYVINEIAVGNNMQQVLTGEPYALGMHSDLLKKLHHQPEGNRYIPKEEVAGQFQDWLSKHFKGEKVTVAGKNFMGFDMQFLKKLPNFDVSQFNHRNIDPAMLYWDIQRDEKIPNLKTCMERAGLEGKVAHTALEDALVVVKLLRYAATNMSTVEEES